MTDTTLQETQPEKARRSRIYDLLLVYVLLAAAVFRFSGIYWGDYQFLHPDERFLVWVGSDISPVSSLSEHFDSANSSRPRILRLWHAAHVLDPVHRPMGVRAIRLRSNDQCRTAAVSPG